MHELLYTSVAPQGLSDIELEKLLSSAREKNQQLGVTGMLVYDNREIMQLLEGEESTLQDLFSTIESDQRHTSVNIFHQGSIESRAFVKWSMAYKALDASARASLIEGYEDFDHDRSPINCIKESPNLGKSMFLNLRKML